MRPKEAQSMDEHYGKINLRASMIPNFLKYADIIGDFFSLVHGYALSHPSGIPVH